MPESLNNLATCIESSGENPPFWKSAEFIFIEIAKSEPTSSLHFFIISICNLALFSSEPPHSSVLRFMSGDKNCESRYP